MSLPERFWENKPLASFSDEEWESLCDSCGLCCLYKLEDEDTHEVLLTSVACRFLDPKTCRCQIYENRFEAVPTCLKVTRETAPFLTWLPETCAYRRVTEGRPLPGWHPLVSGNSNAVHRAGVSARGRFTSETDANMDRLEDYIISSDEE